MRANEVLGIIFSNVHDEMMAELTEKRSIASVPFGGRYRIIDFSLSNLVNAGIRKVGIITKANYHSLMDHLGAGRSWDLDRKKGGLFILPPYINGNGLYDGNINALIGVMTFLKHCTEKYVVLCDSDVVGNIDIEPIVDRHIKNDADVTVAYKYGIIPKNQRDIMLFDFDGNEKVKDIVFAEQSDTPFNYSLDIMVLKLEKLIELVETAAGHNYTSFSINVLQRHLSSLTIYGYKVDNYTAVMDSIGSYYKANMDLLDKSVREQLFDKSRPIYTKTRDDMPAKYGISSKAANCIIGDGCKIEGTVENSVIFRGVKIGRDAVVKNCILMQDTVIEDGANLTYVTTDKNVVITKGRCLTGSENYPMVIRKNTIV